MKRIVISTSLLLLLDLGLVATLATRAVHAKAQPNENGAVILGEAGESYPIYGTGGIKVTGGHHGIFSSNWKHSEIEIDGSGITAQKFIPATKDSDFAALAGGVYFVTHSATCTLGPATAAAGEEIVVCNAVAGTTITYQAGSGTTLLGASQSAPTTNTTLGKVDRFISDGTNWFKE